MRNLKRALSLALASVMLLGMMVVGTSAASTSSFTDAEKISQAEAVDITTGLGIFEGYPDGSFQPATPVTRAQMAVIITKILHNVGGDPSIYEGAGLFTDVPKWAEGYVNMAASMGIIVGRGNGIFDPNATVTTAEAATMLLKALGYYGADDQLGADWKLAVISKATYLGLYGDLKLDMNAPLTRENVAVLVKETLFAQLVAYNDTRGQYVKTTNRDIVVTNGTQDDLNTLAYNTYGLYKASGIVVANGYTDIALSATQRKDAQTSIKFELDTDLNKDGRVDVTEGSTYEFAYDTGLNMIGHAADVYYTWENRAPVVVAITDQATLAVVIDYSANSTTLTEAATAAGFQRNSILDFVDNDGKTSKVTNQNFAVNFDLDVRYNDKNDPSSFAIDKLIVISNSGNKQVDEVIALDQYLDTVDTVDEIRGETEYSLTAGDGKLNIFVDDVDEGDYVVVTKIGNKEDVYVVYAAELVNGNLTRITGISNATADVKRIVVDGTTYKKSSVDPITGDKEFTEFADIVSIGAVTMVMDHFGDVIGLTEEAAPVNYAYVAQFGYWHVTSGLNTKNDVLAALIYFADGTSGTYEVDTKNSDAYARFKGQDLDVLNGKGAANLLADGGYKGIYNVTIRANGKAEIDVAPTLVNTDTANEFGKTHTSELEAEGTQLIKKHSTLVDKSKKNVTAGTYTLMNNDDTVYFYVTGSYAADDLKVAVITGIDNAEKVTNSAAGVADPTIDQKDANNTIGYGIREVIATQIRKSNVIGQRAEINAMLIQGVRATSEDIYYYNEGNYVVEAAESGTGYVVTYTLYSNKTGETVTVTYNNDGKNFETVRLARTEAQSKFDGFYRIGATDLDVVIAEPAHADAGKFADVNGTYYVINDTAYYDAYTRNLFTEHYDLGTISGSVVIVDVCNSGLDTLQKLTRAIRNEDYKGDVKLSFSVKDYETKVIFVAAYDPDGTEAPNTTPTADVSAQVTNISYASGTGLTATVTVTNDGDANAVIKAGSKVTYTVYRESRNGSWDKVATAVDTVASDITVAARADDSTLKHTFKNITVSGTGSYKVEVSINVSGLGTISGDGIGDITG